MFGKLLTFFDYVFYRAYLFFERRNWEEDPWQNAANTVVLSQAGVLLVALVVLDSIWSIKPEKRLTVLPIVIAGTLILWNYSRYRKPSIKKDNYAVFRNRWDGEDARTRRIRGWLIVLLLVGTWVGFIPISMALSALLS